MIQELELLKDYASKHNINDLTSEDIVKLMTTPYIIEDIANAFNISVKEFNEIRKQKGVTNVILEDTVRNIEAILAYINDQNILISENIQKKIVNDFTKDFLISTPKKDFYIKKISEINFTREKILSDIVNKNIDVEYRINELGDTISYIKKRIEILKKEEKNYLLNYNDEKLYKQLLEEKNNGKIFKRDDLTPDILFELAIIENKADSLIGKIYNLTIKQVRYLRRKYNILHKPDTKLKRHPEMIIYGLEEKNMKAYNYEYQKIAENVINSYNNKNNITINESSNDEITINIDGKDETYYINFSDEKFSTNTKSSNRKHNGSHHNYKNENETKINHGKRGEKLAFEAEKIRLEKLGLYDVINDVKLVTQIDEDITFDGLGYDLISFNEFKERICIEVKTSYSKKDKPFFISKKELEILQGLKEEYNCQNLMIYYVRVDGNNVTIKTIEADDISTLDITPVLYKVG